MKNINRDSNILEIMPVGLLFIKMAIPAVLSQLINILYNLVIHTGMWTVSVKCP